MYVEIAPYIVKDLEGGERRYLRVLTDAPDLCRQALIDANLQDGGDYPVASVSAAQKWITDYEFWVFGVPPEDYPIIERILQGAILWESALQDIDFGGIG